MLAVGVVEILAGVLVAVRPAIGGYVVAAWLLGIIVNLVTMGAYLDVALRDVGLLAGALALARLASPTLTAPPAAGRDARDSAHRRRCRPRVGRPAVVSWRPIRLQRSAAVDLDLAEKAAADLLAALGQPVDSPDMAETPRRMAHAYAEMLTAGAFDFTTFANAEGYDELVLVEDIPVRSVCEHTCCRSWRGTCRLPARRTDPRPVEVRTGGGPLQPPRADAGAVDQADRGAPRAPARTTRCRCRDRGRAHLHEPAGSPRGRRPDESSALFGALRDNPLLTRGVPLTDPQALRRRDCRSLSSGYRPMANASMTSPDWSIALPTMCFSWKTGSR